MNTNTRKSNRLINHDYSQGCSYFVTICTKEQTNFFWQKYTLSNAGQVTENEILQIQNIYVGVFVEHYVIMPNHVHMIISIHANGRQDAAPSLSRIIGSWKRAISLKLKFSPWQKSFHDHIIRDEASHKKIAEYIRTNPTNWKTDCFYIP